MTYRLVVNGLKPIHIDFHIGDYKVNRLYSINTDLENDRLLLEIQLHDNDIIETELLDGRKVVKTYAELKQDTKLEFG